MPSEQILTERARASLRALINVPEKRLESLLWRMAEGGVSSEQKRLATQALEAYTNDEFPNLRDAIIYTASS